MASLPPISFHTFTQIQPDAPPINDTPQNIDSEQSPSEDGSNVDSEAEEPSLSTLCVFCSTTSLSLDANFAHMSSHHAFVIPNLSHLTDLESFIVYLNTLVQSFHECIYCGHTKHSVEGIRQHMQMKRHCKLSLDEESDMLDFWEFFDVDNEAASEDELRRAKIQRLSQAEMILPSGAVVTPRSSRAGGKQLQRHRKTLAAPPESESTELALAGGQALVETNVPPTNRPQPRGQALALRNEMGMIGVSSQQRLALRAVEKKMLKQETLARAHQRWTVEKGANRQKHFKVRFIVVCCVEEEEGD